MPRIAIIVIAILVATGAGPEPVAARSLESKLGTASELVGISSGSAFDALAESIADTAARSLPVISSSAGFTYRYNTDTEIFERTSETLGPLFLERPDTLGKGKFNVGVSFQYVEFNAFDGQDLTDLHNDNPIVVQAFDAAGNPAGLRANRLRYSLGLQNYVTAISLTYGILDNLDVNLLVPIIVTNLRIGVHSQEVATGVPGGPFSPSAGPEIVGRTDGGATGVGDLLLRAKYQLPRGDCLRSAVGFQMRLPSGSASNFQGTGDVELSPFFYVSTLLWGRVEPHANVGIDVNASDVDQSAARYGVGADVDVTKRFNFNLAFLGRSQFSGIADEEDTEFLHLVGGRTVRQPLLGLDFGRKDVLDLSFGFRLNVWGNVMLFANGIYALNDQGLRNDRIIPAGGIEGTF